MCKRFWRACLRLPLDISIDGSVQHTPPLALLQALQAFLDKHAPPVRSLRFYSDSDGAAAQEEVAVLAACLALCSAAGSPVERLDVLSADSLPTSYLPGLLGLRQLRLSTGCTLRLPAGISKLTALADVRLESEPLYFEGPLPPSITFLRIIIHDDSTQPAPQVEAPCVEDVWQSGTHHAAAWGH